MLRRFHLSLASLAAALLLAASPARAQDLDQREPGLFNPAPRELWRPMSADRPDLTESPRTVDPGVVQLETSFFEYAHDSTNDDSQTTDTLALTNTNLKLGLLDDVDLQIVFAPYVREETRPDGAGMPTTIADGVSDVDLRIKLNLWGNDGGATALGILPFVKIPSGSAVSNDHVEGGVALPFGWDLAEGLSLGVMPELDVVYDDASGHDLAFFHTVVLGFDIHGPLAGYVEYAGTAFFDGADYEGLASFGLTWAITEHAVLDGGAVLGLTRAAPDVAVFTGITLRF